MAKKKQSQGTQKLVQKADASNDSTPYEVVSNMTDTKDRHRYKEKKPFICKCKKNTNINTYKPSTWNSVTKIYGNTNTTQVWDKDKNKPKPIFKTKERKKFRLKQFPQNIIKDEECPATRKSERIKKHGRYSIISLYKKSNKIKNLKTREQKKQDHLNRDIRSPVINIELPQKPKIYPVINDDGIGDVCVGGPCEDAIECYNPQRLKGDAFNVKNNKMIDSSPQVHMCKCNKKYNKVSLIDNESLNSENRKKSSKSKKICKCKIEMPHEKIDKTFKTSQRIKMKKTAQGANVGHGDQLLPIDTHRRKHIKCKCNFIDKILRHTCKCKLDNEYGLQTVRNVGDQTGEPYFEIKVDSENLQVLNALEIKENVNTFGRLQKPHSCICPSRKKHTQLYTRNTCEKGICEKAMKNKQTNFDCKCLIRNKVIKCKDTTCDSKRYIKQTKKRKLYQSPTYIEKNTPLFEVLLDQDNMNIVNTTEIHNVFKKASNNEVCPTGICRIAADNKNIQLNCTCIKKKIKPIANECTQESCQLSDKKYKLSYLCSRVFSKSENWNRSERKSRRHRYNKRPLKKGNIKAKSDTFKRKGLTINVTRDYNQKQKEILNNKSRSGEDLWCKCFCICDGKKVQPTHNTLNIESKKKENKTKKKKFKPKLKRQIRYLVNRQNTTYVEKLLQCLKIKLVSCEKKLKAEEKAFREQEEKTNKENHKIKKKQQKSKNIEAQNWNCLTKFVSGIINLTASSIKNLILAIIGIVTNPVGSYVYTRERLKNIPGTMKRFQDWIIRTWRSRSSKLSQTIKDSETMNVIADQIEDTAFYNTFFAKKGRTSAEKAYYEKMSRLRKRRIRKRYDVALYGCRHMLLTTMRKTPCLWFYHICPDLYPQCLSLITFMNNFLSVLIYLLAFLCWTPCILSFEICRAFLCCFFCTH